MNKSVSGLSSSEAVRSRVPAVYGGHPFKLSHLPPDNFVERGANVVPPAGRRRHVSVETKDYPERWITWLVGR